MVADLSGLPQWHLLAALCRLLHQSVVSTLTKEDSRRAYDPSSEIEIPAATNNHGCRAPALEDHLICTAEPIAIKPSKSQASGFCSSMMVDLGRIGWIRYELSRRKYLELRSSHVES